MLSKEQKELACEFFRTIDYTEYDAAGVYGMALVLHIAALEAEVERLKKALKPFAFDGDDFTSGVILGNAERWVSVSDVKDARAALKGE